MHYRTKSGRIFDLGITIFFILLSAAMMFPIYYIIVISFSSSQDLTMNRFLLWPKHWDFSAYRYILNSESFRRAMLFTIYITGLGTVCNLLFTSTMAYGLTKQIYGQKVLLFMVTFTLLFGAGMIPSYLVVKAMGLRDSIWALILPNVINSFNLIVMRQFFKNIPNEIQEAGVVDGANPMQIFIRIILPLSKPALAAFGLFYAVDYWNSYFNAILYINDPHKWPIQVILRQIVIINEPTATLGRSVMMQNPPQPESIQMAAILLATLPVLLVYPFLQKHFAKGVMIGSIKG
ncbi:carbohydrate ABC transporter permease [Paenibacillus sp. 19GGS1-52]|uniref:carbohydrate ABC transporter permease n=1 Tax=Paenibacillus sp. 19GGS1-52 TaxID=2758563 RepID=UPI001EFA3DB9|nr:carbohydrate ABC transporter permease [Paenibacillus sp. 19GGS1-52]ULO09786.1 carbohydrate ABC transporter permease [Paenibacillus sp. 19GGS1-52]